jgi:ribosome-associated protein
LIEPVQVARRIVEVVAEKQATDILLLDVTGVASFADYFVILSAGSSRQMNALREDVVSSLKEVGAGLHHQEGVADSGWVLLDYGDVIVHIFSPEEREYYQLERLWSQGVPLIRIQ